MHAPAPSLVAAALAILVGACSPTPSPTPAMPSEPGGVSPTPAPSGAAGPIPVLVDTDFGADDLLAISVLLRDPKVDVQAIAIDGTGLVHCAEGMRNMRRLLAAFGRSEIPIGCGRETPGPNGREFPADWRAGADALYGIDLPPASSSRAGEDAATLIADTIKASATPMSIVALGPWTNLADAFAADPGLAGKVRWIHAMAGALDVPGNVEVGGTTAADGVEWNVGADPKAFADVLALDVPVTLVPLDATNDIPVPADVADRLAGDHAAAGADIAYELYARNPFLTGEGNYLWDPLAALTLTSPDLATWEDAIVVVTQDGAQAGRLVRNKAGSPIRFASGADGGRAYEALFAALRRGEPRPSPFTLAGALRVRWDGSACVIDGTPPSEAGVVAIELVNDGDTPAGLLIGGIRPPKSWADALAFTRAADFGDPDLQVPDWIIPVDGGSGAEPGQTSSVLSELPAGTVGVACAVGTWPDFDVFDGGSFNLAE